MAQTTLKEMDMREKTKPTKARYSSTRLANTMYKRIMRTKKKERQNKENLRLAQESSVLFDTIKGSATSVGCLRNLINLILYEKLGGSF